MTKKNVVGKNAKTDLTNAPSSRSEVNAFLQKVASLPAVRSGSGSGKLVFALDATASRERTWDQASQLQVEMFSSTQALGGLQVQLSYFRGFGEFYASQWFQDSSSILKKMSGIHCHAGATQIKRLLKHVLQENKSGKIHSVVFIGDAMEENVDILCQLAGEMGMLNIPLFVFQERNDPIAQRAFMEMARLSKGAFSHFDSASVAELKDLLRAVAIYAVGGYKALAHFSKTAHPKVKLLSQQLR